MLLGNEMQQQNKQKKMTARLEKSGFYDRMERKKTNGLNAKECRRIFSEQEG